METIVSLAAAREAVHEAGLQIMVRRRRLRLSQKQLADLTDVAQQVISEIETGRRVATEDEMRAIEEALTTLEAEA